MYEHFKFHSLSADFQRSYTRVFCGNQASSWHGTSLQAAHPLPFSWSPGNECNAATMEVDMINNPSNQSWHERQWMCSQSPVTRGGGIVCVLLWVHVLLAGIAGYIHISLTKKEDKNEHNSASAPIVNDVANSTRPYVPLSPTNFLRGS